VRVSVICVGGVKGHLASVIGDYEARAARYWRLQVTEVPAGLSGSRKAAPQEVMKAEGERLLGLLPDPGETVALTRSGRALTSRALAELLQEGAVRSTPEVAFLIGGAFGLGQEVLARSSARLSLSALTLPHELARLLLAEQLYRAGTIARNEPYHKGP
jgi:23S rRNA (pseudouridine1915-N3)-methyltransferase